MNDAKVYLLNISSMFIANINMIEPILEIMLLAITIGYTAHRWVLMKKKYKK